MTIIEKILLELCAKDVVEDGMPDFTNEKHLLALNEVLVELNWPMDARSELLYTLMEKENIEDKYPAVSIDSKDGSKKTVYFKSKEKRDAAIKKGTHEKSSEKDPDDKDDKKQTSTKVTDFERQPTSDDDKEEKPQEDEKDIIKRIESKNVASGRKHVNSRFDEDRINQIKIDHPEYEEYEEDLKLLEDLLSELTHPDTAPERKQEIAVQLRNDFGLKINSPTTNEQGQEKPIKLYITRLPSGKPAPRFIEKFLTGGKKDPASGTPSTPQARLVDEINNHLPEDDQISANNIGGDNESRQKQNFVTDAKPSFSTPKRTKTRKNPKANFRKKDKNNPGYDVDGNKLYITDPVVESIFADPPLSDLEDKEAGSDVMHSLEGPGDEDGNLIAANTPENQRKHMEWMVDENAANQKIKDRCDEYIRMLESQDPRDETEIKKFKDLKKSIENYENKMKKILKEKKIPSKEAEDAVKKANAELMDDMHNAHPNMAEGIAKQVAEVALVQQELAAGEECYLPTAGNFPGGDKVRVTRDGTTVEKVVGVSVKYGRGSGNTQIYGFPAEAASVSKYAEVPQKEGESDEAHKKRKDEVRTRSGGKVGQPGYSIGVRDDIIDDRNKHDEVLDSSGLGDAVKDKDELHKINTEIKDEIDRYKEEQRKAGKSEEQIEIDLQDHMKEFMSSGSPSINERFEKSIDRVKLRKIITGSEDKQHSNTNMARKCDPIEFINLATIGSVIREGQGMPSLAWNHQEYKNGDYKSETVEPDDVDMTNLACWGFLSRMYRSSGRAKGGGILTTGTGECDGITTSPGVDTDVNA